MQRGSGSAWDRTVSMWASTTIGAVHGIIRVAMIPAGIILVVITAGIAIAGLSCGIT